MNESVVDKRRTEDVEGPIFITGAGGYLGSELANSIDWTGKLFLLTRKRGGLDWIKPRRNVEVVVGDMCNLDFMIGIMKKIRPKIIYNFAANIKLPEDGGQDYDLLRNNIVSVVNLCEAVRFLDYDRLINIGSSSECIGNQNKSEEKVPCDHYGFSKLVMMNLIINEYYLYCKNNLSLRLFYTYGGYIKDQHDILRWIYGEIMRGGEIRFMEMERDFVAIDDLIRALKAVALSKFSGLNGQIIDIGTGRSSKISAMIDKVVELTGVKIKKIITSESPYVWVANTKKAKELLGWVARLTIHQGTTKYLEVIRGQGA